MVFTRTALQLGWALALPLLVSLTACSGSEEEALARSVVLVTLGTTRADALGGGGGVPGTTPNLDALANESLRYRWARTVAPLTLPAHTSMFTGYYPPRHGVRGDGPMVVPEGLETLAERARWSGFETAAFVGSLALRDELGIAQGFRGWRQPERGDDPTAGPLAADPADKVVSNVIHWLGRRNPTQPFFLWIHLSDARAPYTPLPEFRDQTDPYLAEISGVDLAFGRLLDALGAAHVLDAPLIAVVGDHGEGRGDHGEQRHGFQCYDSTLRVPFFLHYPDAWRAGEVSDELVSLVDVFPTLLEFMGMGVPQDIDGLSLLRRAVPAERGVYFETYHGWQRFGWSPLVGWADREGKYIHSSSPEFFRPQLDPRERDNLLADLTGEQLASEPYLEALRQLDGEPRFESDNDFSVRAEVLEELLELGYTAAADSPPALPPLLAELQVPVPREQVQESAEFLRAVDLIATGDYAGAVPILDGVVARHPRNPAALDALAEALIKDRDHARALPVLMQRLALPPEVMETHRDLMACFEALGDPQSAHAHSLRSLELLVRTYQRLRRREQASRAHGLLMRVRQQGVVELAPSDAARGDGAAPE